ncbi:MAG: ergothioneine biosynthesis protein EgtB [Flavobacteriales bacterium]|nr:ergothioneine biosynthesis protein EgtB [Flavobacteriales bacterium]
MSEKINEPVLTNRNLLDRFVFTREYTERLVEFLQVEDFVIQPTLFVSPPKWHLAHTTWFFEEFVLAREDRYVRVNPEYAYLFNSYYNDIGSRIPRIQRGMQTRPTVAEVFEYRKRITESVVEELLREQNNPDNATLIELGIQHEQQHQELLLTDIKYILGTQYLRPGYAQDVFQSGTEHIPVTTEEYISISGGVYAIGHEGNSFHFDNERPRHNTLLSDFKICDGLVRNADYLEFIADGAYNNPMLWLDEGWSWINQHMINAPMYWEMKHGIWMHYTLDGLKPVEPETPTTHVSYYEADAFANWQGKRLPTEFEWEIASEHFAWGDRWEWTCSSYEGYPGYRAVPGAIGEYNGKFMINQRVLRGGSFATPNGHSRKTYRNFFHPDMRWQYTGIRLAARL